jgi:hypothetical protein
LTPQFDSILTTRSSFEGDCPQAKELEEEDDDCGGAFLLFEGIQQKVKSLVIIRKIRRIVITDITN